MRIALATCAPFPPVVDDEEPLRAALRARGVEVCEPAWDAPFDWAGCDAVLLRTTWDYHTRAAEFLAWCERIGRETRLFAGPATVRWNIDKRYLKVLEAAGVPIAETLWVAPGEVGADELVRELTRRGWARAFLKPVVGANAWGTLRFDCDAAGLEEARRHVRTAAVDFMLQPYLSAVEVEGELSVIVIDGVVSHGVRKIPGAGDYRVQEDWGAVDVAWEPEASALELAERACAAASAHLGEPLLYARVDFLRTDAGLVVNELELIEPALFQRHGPSCGARLADALIARITAPR